MLQVCVVRIVIVNRIDLFHFELTAINNLNKNGNVKIVRWMDVHM